MRKRISRLLCFMLTLELLFSGGLWIAPASADSSTETLSVIDSTYDPVTILNKDFTQANIGQTASQLGFDYNTLASGTGSAVIESDPVTNMPALHMNATGVTTPTGGNNEFQISKTFGEAQTGTISTEITFMQTGSVVKDRILQFTPSSGSMNILNTGVNLVSGSGAFVYFQTTAPSGNLGAFTPNKWYTMRVDFNTVNQKYDLYINGTLVVARTGMNSGLPTYDLKKLTIGTPTGTISGLTGSYGDLYVRNIKVTRVPFNPHPAAPTVLSVNGRNTKINWTAQSYVHASKYRMRVKEKGQSDWLMISATANYSDLTNKTNNPATTDIKTYYDPVTKKNISLQNGKTYVVGLSVVTRDELGVYSKGVPTDYEGDMTCFEATPAATTPITAPDSSVMGSVMAYANYYSSMWSVKSGAHVGDLVFADKSLRFTSVPSAYTAMDWIQTSQYDTMKYPTAADGTVQNQIIGFQMRDKGSVYIAMDANETPPSWMSAWVATGESMTMSDTASTYTFKIYKRDFDAGSQVLLGYNDYTAFAQGKNAGYFVMAERSSLGLALDASIKQWVNTPVYSVAGSIKESVYGNGYGSVNGSVYGSSVTLSVYQNQNPVPVYNTVLDAQDFNFNLSLVPGSNYIEVYAKRNGSTLFDKVTATINLDTVVPEIRVSPPPQTVKDAVYNLQGSLSKAAYLTIRLNGEKIVDSVAKAVYEPFSYPITLSEGMNNIEVSSSDIAGNVKTVGYTVQYVFWGGQASAGDFNGNSVNAVTASTNIIAQRQVTNTTDSPKSIMLWFVLYDANNTIIQYSCVAADFNAGETKTLSAGFILPPEVTGYHVKAFLWDSLDGMKPLSDQFQLQ